ncbi:MAG: ATP-binding cassette domain-containing protein, partial [bacterium]
MADNTEKKVLLSLKNVVVKFNVRGRILTAIRNVSLDVYENESLAIVGESGSGKSVLTKTFAGMLDSNGFIPQGTIIFSDDELAKTDVVLDGSRQRTLDRAKAMLDKYAPLERGAKEFQAIEAKKAEIKAAQSLSRAEEEDFAARLKELDDTIIDKNNYLWTLDKKADAAEYAELTQLVKELGAQKVALQKEKEALARKRKAEYAANTARQEADKKALAELEARRQEKIAKADKEGNPHGLSDKVLARNQRIAYEIVLSIGRYPVHSRAVALRKLAKGFKSAMESGEDLEKASVLNRLFESVAFRVEFRSYDEATKTLHGYGIIDCAKIKFTKDWQQIRGRRIATVFQDPMTSLNPVITIGEQIMTVILKHQKCSKAEARERTIDIMGKVGIPNPEKRFDDYPFEYSGGMRQRIVIAIALSCQPKILICDEPTTALDVTIQAQIIRLIKSLQQELGFTTVYITHDLGVV